MQKNTYKKEQLNNWDMIVITVNNYKQKEFAEKEILKRKKLKYISENTKVLIRIAPKGFETGSTLIKLINKINILGKKVLYIPSAGKSQRTFYYFKKGKLWIPTKGELSDGEDKTIFDDILENTKPILEKIQKGILICCSDVVIKFDDKIDIIKKDKAYVFSNVVDKDLGTRHGTFKINANNKVEEVCQKESIEVLEKKGFIKDDKVNIDTGMLIIPNNVVEKLKNIKIKDKKIGIYEELIPMFCKENILNAIPLKKANFIHYGSSLEILKLKGNENGNYFENSENDFYKKTKNVMLFNTKIDRKIPDDVIIYTAKLKNNKWVSIILGIEDDIKAKGKNIRLFKKEAAKILRVNDISQRSLWNLSIYEPGNTSKEALNNALELYDLVKNNLEIVLRVKNKLSIEKILRNEI